MAETKIPNSEDLFEIYKSQLNLVNDINQIIVKNKMDKKFFNALKKCIERSTDAIETVLYGLERISGAYAAVSIRGKDLKNMTDTIYEYQILMETIGKVPVKLLMFNKIRMILLRKSMRSMFKFIEKLGEYNPIKIVKAKISLKAMEPIMEAMEIVASPLNKISLKQLWNYKTAIRRYKRIFRRIIGLITYIGEKGIIPFASAKLNMKFIADALGVIPDILSILERKITIWQLLRARNSLKRISKLLFGTRRDMRRVKKGKMIFPKSVFGLMQSMSVIDPIISIRSRINMLMIKGIFKDINDTLMYINEHFGWLEKTHIQKNIGTLWLLLFGEEYGWLGRNVRTLFKKSTIKKKGVMDVVVGVFEALSQTDVLKAAAMTIALVVFFKAINIVLKSINMYTGLFGRKRFKAAQKGLGHIYSILFSGAKWRQWRNAKNEGERVSILSIIQAFKDNEQIFHEGFECIVNIAGVIVNIFRTLLNLDAKQALKSLTALKIMRFNFNTILRISRFVTDKDNPDKINAAIEVTKTISILVTEMNNMILGMASVEKMTEFLEVVTLSRSAIRKIIKITKLIGNDEFQDNISIAINSMRMISIFTETLNDAITSTPKFKDAVNLNLVLISATIAIFEFAGMVWLINKAKLADQDANNTLKVFDDMGVIMVSLKQAVDNTPKFADTINLNLVLISATIAIFEFAGMVWLINKAKLADQDINGTLAVFNGMSVVMMSLKRASDNAPSFIGVLNLMIIMPIITIVILEYWILLKFIGKINLGSDSNKAQAFFKDMSKTLKDFCEVINNMPEPKKAMKAAATMPIIMVIIGGYILVMSLISTKITQTRKSYRVITSMIGAIGGIVLIILAMITAGAMIVLGMVLIGITFTFIATMLGLMALLSMAGKFLKRGAIALLLIDAAILGMVATLALMALLAETIDLKQIALTMLVMITTLGAMALMIYGFAKFEKEIMKGMIPMTLIIILTGMAALVMGIIGKVAKETEAGDLLGTSQIMTLVMAELGAMVFVLSKIPKQDLLIGEAALGGITLILNAAMPAFRSLGEVATMTDAGDLLGTSQIMALVIAELGGMAAIAGFLLLGPQAAAFALGEAAMWTISKVAQTAAQAMKALAEASMTMDAAGITGDPTEVARKLSEKILIPLRALQLAPEATHDRKGLFGKKGYEAGSVLDYLSQLGLVEMGKSALKIASISKTVLKIKDICTAAMQVTAMPPINPDKLTAPIFAIVGRDGEGGIVFALNKVKRKKLRQTKRKVKTISKILHILNKIAKRAVKLSKWKIPDNFNDQMDALGNVIEKTVTVTDEKLKTDVVSRILTNTKSYLMSVLVMNKATDVMIKTQAKAKDITVHTINNGTEDTLTISWMASRFLKDISEAGSVSKEQIISLGLLMKLPYDGFLETCGKYENLKFIKIEDKPNTPAGHAIEYISKSIFQNVNGSNLNQRTSAWKQATDDSVKLIKSVNTLDISKVTSLKELMHELYLFSDSIQGNFDKLADVINEKLLTVLEKLTNSLDKVSETDFGEPSGTGKPTPIANPAHNANEDTRKNSKDNATKKAVEQLQSDMNSLKSLINDLSKCIDRSGQAALRITEINKY